MGDAYIPITRRHYAGQTALEAGMVVNQEWGYDETNERVGVRMSDGTYRYHSRSELYPPGAGVVPKVSADSSGVGLATTRTRGVVGVGLPTEELHFMDMISTAPTGNTLRSIKIGFGTSGVAYIEAKDWLAT